MTEKSYLDKYDIAEMFDCSEVTACKIIRGIKSVSDTLGLKGKVTQVDLDVWMNRNNPVKEVKKEEPDAELLLAKLLTSLIKKELSTTDTCESPRIRCN